MSSSQFPNFNFATCVCLSDIWYKFIFLCICALAWNVLPYCQNARFGSCWLAGRLATSFADQLPSTDCLPIIAPWPLLPSYDFPPKCFGMYKSTENQNGQLHFIRVPTIALSTDCSIQLPGVSSLSLFVFLFLDFPLVAGLLSLWSIGKLWTLGMLRHLPTSRWQCCMAASWKGRGPNLWPKNMFVLCYTQYGPGQWESFVPISWDNFGYFWFSNRCPYIYIWLLSMSLFGLGRPK